MSEIHNLQFSSINQVYKNKSKCIHIYSWYEQCRYNLYHLFIIYLPFNIIYNLIIYNHNLFVVQLQKFFITFVAQINLHHPTNTILVYLLLNLINQQKFKNSRMIKRLTFQNALRKTNKKNGWWCISNEYINLKILSEH